MSDKYLSQFSTDLLEQALLSREAAQRLPRDQRVARTDLIKNLRKNIAGDIRETVTSHLEKRASMPETCEICGETMRATDSEPLQCGHWFHRACFEEYAESTTKAFKRCPTCDSRQLPTFEGKSRVDLKIGDFGMATNATIQRLPPEVETLNINIDIFDTDDGIIRDYDTQRRVSKAMKDFQLDLHVTHLPGLKHVNIHMGGGERADVPISLELPPSVVTFDYEDKYFGIIGDGPIDLPNAKRVEIWVWGSDPAYSPGERGIQGKLTDYVNQMSRFKFGPQLESFQVNDWDEESSGFPINVNYEQWQRFKTSWNETHDWDAAMDYAINLRTPGDRNAIVNSLLTHEYQTLLSRTDRSDGYDWIEMYDQLRQLLSDQDLSIYDECDWRDAYAELLQLLRDQGVTGRYVHQFVKLALDRARRIKKPKSKKPKPKKPKPKKKLIDQAADDEQLVEQGSDEQLVEQDSDEQLIE